jgi:hypothetical protein
MFGFIQCELKERTMTKFPYNDIGWGKEGREGGKEREREGRGRKRRKKRGREGRKGVKGGRGELFVSIHPS